MAQAAARLGDGIEAREGGAKGLLAAGAAAGLLGGVLMAATLPVGAALAGREPLGQLRALGLSFLGEHAPQGDAALLAWGLLVHLVVSALLGVIFTAILPAGFPYFSSAIVGVGYAWVAMALALELVVPEVNPALRQRMPALGGTWVIAHALYGVGLGAGPPLRQRLRARG